MRLSAKQRNRQMKALRRLIETSDDELVRDYAYVIECAVTYVTKETVGWVSLMRLAKNMARALGPR